MNDYTRSMIGHYVGNSLVSARMSEGKELEGVRKALITKLDGLDKYPAVVKCIDILKAEQWQNPSDVDSFNKQYEEIMRI